MSSKVVILAILALTFLSIKPYEAARILDDEDKEQWMIKRPQNLLLPLLQRGREVGPPSPSGCTWIPGSDGKPCTATISQRNFVVIPTLAATSNMHIQRKWLSSAWVVTK
ncbi:hypothetical protein PHJA_001825300 [Phtheirospermum japonicum]|uniref:Uncharacterized protein n=1 Tax=Phtheirospermum japonicum TaxID=374723 RepID=A0A830CES5_9LAMI|nr:hypothetical protein PHJA_001825300 [Phtheirospermum japonicum]